jgi:hypothetical protein
MNRYQTPTVENYYRQPSPLNGDDGGDEGDDNEVEINSQRSITPRGTASSDTDVYADSNILRQHEEVKPTDDELAQAICYGFRHTAKGFHLILRNWWWEITTWFLGTTALALIVVLLMVFQGRHSGSWHSRIQITAMISALSQVTQSALTVTLSSAIGQLKWVWLQSPRFAGDLDTFDEASRGPEGSLRLLLNLIPWGRLATKQWKSNQPDGRSSRSGFSGIARFIWNYPKP